MRHFLSCNKGYGMIFNVFRAMGCWEALLPKPPLAIHTRTHKQLHILLPGMSFPLLFQWIELLLPACMPTDLKTIHREVLKTIHRYFCLKTNDPWLIIIKGNHRLLKVFMDKWWNVIWLIITCEWCCIKVLLTLFWRKEPEWTISPWGGP